MKFDQVFKNSSRREVNGGAKTPPTTQTEWLGEFMGTSFHLRATVRVLNKNWQFLKPSNARLNPWSWTPEAEFVDIQVLQPRSVSDDILIELAKLGQGVDTRPVMVRRFDMPVRTGFTYLTS